MSANKTALILLAAAALASWAPTAARAESRETAGWHLVRPGEDLASIDQRYRGTAGAPMAASHRQILRPGDRVQVRLDAGLPDDDAIIGVLSGRVEAQPTPVPWTRGRRFDLLTEGDGLRTHAASSVALAFADSSRVVVTEDSLVFLHDAAPQVAPGHPDEIEVVVGQADLRHGEIRRPDRDGIEVVLGEARMRPRSDADGHLSARTRRSPAGDAQVMVYEGSGQLQAAGTEMRLEAGSGSVIDAAGTASPPESLLVAPSRLRPADGARLTSGSTAFRWQPVAGAATYTLELCRDEDCGELVARRPALDEAGMVLDVAAGQYYWRVTATSPSGLDGFPSAATALAVTEPHFVAQTATVSTGSIIGEVRSRYDSTPLPGARVQLASHGVHGVTDQEGRFELPGLSGHHTLQVLLPGFVVARIPNVEAGTGSPLTIHLDPAPITEDAILVTPSRIPLLDAETVTPLGLSRDDMLALPHLGDDILRALPLLPGATANDISAQFHIRGGRRDEVNIQLDGQELYGAFHLKDFDNASSIVAPAALAGVDLRTGGFGAAYGDRMGGILDMRSLEPQSQPQTRLGLGLLTMQASRSGGFAEGQGGWLATLRRGSIDLATDFFGVESPTYWDGFAKVAFQIGERQRIAVHALHADDELSFTLREDGELKTRSTNHSSSYLWATHRSFIGSGTFVDSFASWSELDSHRRALELEEEQHLEIDDRRRLEVLELRQTWNHQRGNHQLTGGFGGRRFDADFDHESFKDYGTPVALLRADQAESRDFVGVFREDHRHVFASDRVRLGDKVVLELGLRWDDHSRLARAEVSPRFNLAYAPTDSTVWRLGWGRYMQTQRPHELAVEDGDFRFYPAEISDQALLGFEHRLGPGPLEGAALRIEAYRREIDQPRPRFDNLYEPYNTFPELEPDRVRFEPERSLSEGVEIFLRGAPRPRVQWWVNYAFASTEDRLDGIWTPRLIDQTHTFNASLAVPLGQHWRLSLAWRYHNGWPTTPLDVVPLAGELDPEDLEEGEEPEPELIPVLGALNSQRLDHYHRLDLRASRTFQTRRGVLTFFVDIQNVYDRQNHSGFDMLVEDGELDRVREYWPGIFPSAGISWEF